MPARRCSCLGLLRTGSEPSRGEDAGKQVQGGASQGGLGPGIQAGGTSLGSPFPRHVSAFLYWSSCVIPKPRKANGSTLDQESGALPSRPAPSSHL